MPKPGIYLSNTTGETVPLAVEGEQADATTLAEVLDEELTDDEKAAVIAGLRRGDS